MFDPSYATHFPNISPVAFNIFGFDIYWYSFAYIIGISVGYLLLKHLNKRSNAYSEQSLDDLLFYSVLGIILGRRLGYMFFYDFAGMVSNPMKIFMIRGGGMSFHGGVIGVIIAIYCVCRKHNLKFLKATDLIVCVAPIGLFLGRIANFINMEMYGKVTDVAWGVVFPNAGPYQRHPTQLYEAFAEGALLFVIMLFLFPRLYNKSGVLSGFFLVYYGIVRFIIEFFKDVTDGHVLFLTTGQALCLPMILLGIGIIRSSHN